MDSVFKSEHFFQNHTGVMTHKLTQPSEDIILNRNAELRKNEGAIQDLGAQSDEAWGRQVASIPFIKYEQAMRDGYDLNSKDKERAGKEMNRFLQSDKGRSCLVTNKL